MSLLDLIDKTFKIHAKESPSKNEEIDALLKFSTIPVPKEYIEIIRLASEIECNIEDYMYIRIWGASGCIELNEAYDIQRYIPKSLAIGDDEGGGALVYLDGNDGFGLYHVGFGNLDIDDAVKIAPTLTDLLINRVGVDVLRDVM